MRAARAIVFAAAVAGCTHDYDALTGQPGTGGAIAGSSGTGRGGAGGVGGMGGSDEPECFGGTVYLCPPSATRQCTPCAVAGRGGAGNTAGTGGVGTGGAGTGGAGNTAGTGGTGNTAGTGSAGNAAGRGGTGNTAGTGGAGNALGRGGAGNAAGTGGAGNAAGAGGSTPMCPSGQIMCTGGACIPVSGDGTIAHCGGCNACPTGATACINGTCGCAVAGQMFCGTACVDTSTNNSHCGACNSPCTGTCTSGICMTTTTCGSTFAVSSTGYVTAPAIGSKCWRGYAYVGGDPGSAITPANFSSCGTPCMLRMSGTLGPATQANNYAGVAFLGFNVGQDASSSTNTTVTPTGTSLTVTFTATTGSQPLRLALKTASTSWCYQITGASPMTIPYSSFNTACWEPATGTAYSKQPFDSIQMIVPGGPTSTAINVTLVSLKEN